MRLNKLFILYSLFGILMASCIKDEAPNAEADITGISFEEDVLANSYIDLNPSYDESQNAYPIRISVKEGTDMTSLAPIFELTPGATISPASGSVQNFTTPGTIYSHFGRQGLASCLRHYCQRTKGK